MPRQHKTLWTALRRVAGKGCSAHRRVKRGNELVAEAGQLVAVGHGVLAGEAGLAHVAQLPSQAVRDLRAPTRLPHLA